MKKKLLFILLIAVVGVFLAWKLRDRSRGHLKDSVTENQPQEESAVPRTSPNRQGSSDLQSELNVQISLKNQPQEVALKEYVRRTLADNKWEWRLPIRFYGKVVDQKNRPIAGAGVHFQWNDLSASGTSDRAGISDGNGEFSLIGVNGKILSVRVEKEGYYTMEGGRGMVSFEYANPAESNFYEPDESHPVVFHLRKKGETEPLLKRSVEVKLPGDGSGVAVDLLTGKVAPSGPLKIKSWKPPYSPEPRPAPYDWRITVEVVDGGFVENQDLLPFTAPEAGYTARIDLHMSPELGQQWRSFVEKNYYFSFGQPVRYGRMQLRTDGDRPIVFVDYVLNPAPGSRNLEFDPAKEIKR